MFNITGGKSVSDKSGSEKKSKKLEPEDIKKLLVGYISVNKQNWSDIPIDSHIRYVKLDGTFVRGGFLTSINIKNGKYFMYLTNNLYNSSNKKNWPVAFDNITTLYKKIDKSSSIEMDTVKNKNVEIITQINKLVDIVKSQGVRLDQLEQKFRTLKH